MLSHPVLTPAQLHTVTQGFVKYELNIQAKFLLLCLKNLGPDLYYEP